MVLHVAILLAHSINVVARRRLCFCRLQSTHGAARSLATGVIGRPSRCVRHLQAFQCTENRICMHTYILPKGQC